MRRSKKTLVRIGLVGFNGVLLISIVGFVLFSAGESHSSDRRSSSLSATLQSPTNPLDKLSSTDIAYNIALLINMPESASVAHEKDAENSRAQVVISDPLVATKPTIITTKIKTLADIIRHVVADGDTIASIARQYSISEDSIRWSNSISRNEELTLSQVLFIPPIEGIVYDVVEGDTVEILAEEFRTDANKVVAFNDTEITGLQPGAKIVIPGGSIVASASNNYNYGFSAAYGFNSYAPGNCTWHTANRWAALGKALPQNLGNAATWVSRAKIAGLSTGKIPRLHAAIQTSTSGYGHIAFVEEVYADGSIRISEMNYNWRLYAMRDKVIPAAESLTHNYIY
jgi:surface antigen